MDALGDITLDMADLVGGVGINIVPLVNPSTVSMTVARAIEDVNPLCVADCDGDFMDGEGRCRQHDNTNGVDICWFHNTTIDGDEICSKGKGALVFETIEEFLCPDPSVQGIVATAVDTTVPNIPYTDSFAADSFETANFNASAASTDWLKLGGEVSRTPVNWAAWEFKEHNGTRCMERPDIGFSTGALGPVSLRDALELCTANYPENCGGVSW